MKMVSKQALSFYEPGMMLSGGSAGSPEGQEDSGSIMDMEWPQGVQQVCYQATEAHTQRWEC
jgi:hypothetical protein